MTLGQYDKAVAELQEGLRLNPDNGLLYANLGLAFLSLDRRNDAKISFDQAFAHKFDSGFLRLFVHDLAFLQGDSAQMEQQLAWATSRPGDEDMLLSAQSDTEACRIILTDTIEATTVGNTILISKGLIDTMPRHEATIASVVALELAHITMGHHIETRYVFNDRLMFPDEASFRRVNMNHNDHDNQEAAQKAYEYMEASMYRDQMSTAGLFWAQLADRGQTLKALNTPKLGDSLLKPNGTPWMATLAKRAPRINWNDLTQIPALPLGSWLNTDPWDDSVHELNAKPYALLNPREKMPLEVTPVYYRLRRCDEEVVRLSQPAQSPSASVAASPDSESNGTDEPSRGTQSKEHPNRVQTPSPEGGILEERPRPEN
jgi:hypothetical protein